MSARRIRRFLALIAVASPLGAQGPELDWTGGVLCSSLDYTLTTDGSATWAYHILSQEQGPTPLSLIDPSDPRVLDVGLDLPQFSGLVLLDAAGGAQVSWALPCFPFLAGKELHSQFVTGPGSLYTVDEISNATRTILGPEGYQHVVSDPGTGLVGHTQTLLEDGRALLLGSLVTTELYVLFVYEPGTMTIEPVSAQIEERSFHTATLLPDGSVFVYGGIDSDSNVLSSAARIVPQPDGGFVEVPVSPAPIQGRVFHTATLICGGRVLIAGGTPLYDPADEVGSFAAAAQLADEFAAIYDPQTDAWHAISDTNPGRGLVGHAASALPELDDEVLLTGGVATDPGGQPASTAETWVYYCSSDSWASGPTMNHPRAFHGQVTTNDTDVLVVGGGRYQPASTGATMDVVHESTLEIVQYGESDLSFTVKGSLPPGVQTTGVHIDKSVPWSKHKLAVLPIWPDGKVFGITSDPTLAGTFVRFEDDGTGVTAIGDMLLPRAGFAASAVHEGTRLLVTGGRFEDPAGSEEIYVLGDGSSL